MCTCVRTHSYFLLLGRLSPHSLQSLSSCRQRMRERDGRVFVIDNSLSGYEVQVDWMHRGINSPALGGSCKHRLALKTDNSPHRRIH